MNNKEMLDSWSIIHFIGCIFLSLIFYWITGNLLIGSIFALIFGIIWEVLDELCYKGILQTTLLDPRGWSITDIIVDALGSFFWLILLWLNIISNI